MSTPDSAPQYAPYGAAPPDLHARAATMAIQLVEMHHEGATGSHLHWLMREISKGMHREFALAAREEAFAAQALHGHGHAAGRPRRARNRARPHDEAGSTTA